ncbi:hypothetical protein ACVRYP_05720 [Streptococcus rifensis]
MNHYQDFLDFLRNTPQTIFIEVEGRRINIDKFIANYINNYGHSVNNSSEGVCILSPNVDKWGVEYRIYLNNIQSMPNYWFNRKYVNRKYHSNEFAYRLDDKKLIEYLFDNGYRLGYN